MSDLAYERRGDGPALARAARPLLPALMRSRRGHALALAASVAHRVPATIAWCQRDRLVAPVIPLPFPGRVVVLRDCGHVPMTDDPDAVARVLLEGSAL